MNVIPQWRRCWRLSSVQAAALLAALSLLQADALPFVQALVPAHVWPWVTAAFGIAIAVLRLIAQPTALQPPAQAEAPQEPRV
ncbi:UNVERIFIED_ORG: hypothetical protein LHJ69_14250 [Shinella sp. XGS7]|nr:hypothetical protein [Shinella sp. XGS7]